MIANVWKIPTHLYVFELFPKSQVNTRVFPLKGVLKINFNYVVCVSCECTHRTGCKCLLTPETVRSLETEITCICELQGVGAGKQTQVFLIKQDAFLTSEQSLRLLFVPLLSENEFIAKAWVFA